MERPLLDSLGLSDVITIRAKSNRPEIIYTVSPAPPMSDNLVSIAIVDWYTTNLAGYMLGSRSQMLVYVTKKKIGVEVAEKLGAPFFESQTDQNEKLRLYEGFRSGALQILVATTAFGAGIDIDTVDVVVHAGSPRSMVDFAQESGRGGRSGQPSLSIVFRTHINKFGDKGATAGEPEMEEWLKGASECRRLGLAMYLDGHANTCASLPKAHLCDSCRSMGANKPSVLDDIQRQIESRKSTKSGLEGGRREDGPTANIFSVIGALASPMRASVIVSSPSASEAFTLPSIGTPAGTHGHSPFIAPRTPAHAATLKRKTPDSVSVSDGAASRRALLTRLGSDLTSPISLLRSNPTLQLPSYSERLLPLLSVMIGMGGVCFVCLGRGETRIHGAGCESERMVTDDGKRSILEMLNVLGNLVKFKLSAHKHCQQCYLPLPVDDIENGFHPRGKMGKCLVFAAAAPKALVFGSHLWVSKVRVGVRTCGHGDPLWFRDVMANCKMMPEPTKESFARIVLSQTDTGELWLLRIFYYMMQQAFDGLV